MSSTAELDVAATKARLILQQFLKHPHVHSLLPSNVIEEKEYQVLRTVQKNLREIVTQYKNKRDYDSLKIMNVVNHALDMPTGLGRAAAGMFGFNQVHFCLCG